ncbi:hypothetical protein GUITHDRAFT_131456 [Guillardia theta CCMP2712]|uniref:PDZ domain-containing protein n=1 Tax=Guillardia theta (strain CCMP2712) TaxID=905079 RepID=L1K3Z5_GUITC|nr:hypothetical protein GUITHDRAFT_131456 [Guillardia theta CCMP2712]EKX55200.1 hypothetical protein GUITHDRAFT_131456 [Guillardia theta CCMP2712]|eukprot:XP_005842180.1 hypothetical protein GUITHDRAFT_131456 [Guillardia theta CCMP2712]
MTARPRRARAGRRVHSVRLGTAVTVIDLVKGVLMLAVGMMESMKSKFDGRSREVIMAAKGNDMSSVYRGPLPSWIHEHRFLLFFGASAVIGMMMSFTKQCLIRRRLRRLDYIRPGCGVKFQSTRGTWMVSQVSSEGALKGGVAEGDLLLDVDGMDVRNRRMISKYLRGAPWSKVRLRLKRSTTGEIYDALLDRVPKQDPKDSKSEKKNQ